MTGEGWGTQGTIRAAGCPFLYYHNSIFFYLAWYKNLSVKKDALLPKGGGVGHHVFMPSSQLPPPPLQLPGWKNTQQ